MTGKEFADDLKGIITDLKSKGTAAIYTDNLIAYLDNYIKSPERDPGPLPPQELERLKAEWQHWNDSHRARFESNLEMFRSVITAGQSAIKSSFLLNGGAAVAMLAFIGHLAQFERAMVKEFASSLLPFSYGVLAIVVTSGLTYLSQWFYADYKERPISHRLGLSLNIACIVLGIASYAFFAWGLFATFCLFKTYPV